MRKLFLLFALSLAARAGSAAIVDRVAAVVDRQVVTVSEVNQMVELRFFPRSAGQSDDAYRRSVLDLLITQALRLRDVERFGAEEIPKPSIDARLREISGRFSGEELSAALSRAELTADEIETLIKRQLQVEAYIQERFSPLVFVSNDEIDTYYRGPWSAERRKSGLAVPPLSDVRDEINKRLKSARLQEEVDKWTAELRARANVDIFAWK